MGFVSRRLQHRVHLDSVSGLCFAASLAVLSACDSGGSSSSDASNALAVLRGNVSGTQPVARATLSFVEAFTVGASPTSVQPLEDLAATATLEAVTDDDGEFSISVPPGRYYVFVTPPAGDTVHLPGGQFSRTSLALAAGSAETLDITLSERPPDDAVYVGSSTCLGCHSDLGEVKQTLHFLGLRALTPAGSQPSSLQDLAKFPNADVGLTYYPDAGPEDNTGPGDGLGFRLVTEEGYNVLLGIDANGYFQALESPDGARVSTRLYIRFTYGGEGRFRQLYATRLDDAGAFTDDATAGTYHLLPGQFSETMGERDDEVTVPGWTTYHPERWAAPPVDGASPAQIPSAEQSFDNDCAGCHFTGMSLTRTAGGLFQAHAVPDPGGPLDFDGDGLAEEMNVGCERCHGPGSAHAAQAGGSIVQPAYLSPGRANLVCGQCHIAGTGNGTIGGSGRGGYPSRNAPDTDLIEFVQAGIGAAEFFGTSDGTGILPDFGTTGGFFNPVDLTTESASWRDATDGHGGRLDHSRGNTQHYLDHLRSNHAQNPFEMLACWDCHDSHAREENAQASEAFENNVLCLRCHAGQTDFASVTPEMVDAVAGGGASSTVLNTATHEHIRERTFELIDVSMNLAPEVYANPQGADRLGRCTLCHMPRTAKSGGWVEDDEGFLIRGDLSSHTFDNISPDVSESMAASNTDSVPNSCVECHRGIPRGSWPDYRFKKD